MKMMQVMLQVIFTAFVLSIASSVSAYDIFSDDFDSLTVGQAVQSPFTGSNAYFVATTSQFFSSPNSVTINNATVRTIKYSSASSTQGTVFSWVKAKSIGNFSSAGLQLVNPASGVDLQIRMIDNGTSGSHRFQCGRSTGGEVEIDATPWLDNEWYGMLVQWEYSTSSITYRCGYQSTASGITYSDWYIAPAAFDWVDSVTVLSSLGSGRLFFDSFTTTLTSDPGYIETSGYSLEYDTAFVDLDISNATSGVLFDVEYFLDQTEINSTVSATFPQQVSFSYSIGSSTNVTTVAETIDHTANGTGYVSHEFVGLSDGVYDAIIRYTNTGVLFGQPRPFPQSYITAQFTISGGVLTGSQIVQNHTAEIYNEIYIAKPCDVEHIDGCIINALTFLFVPTQTDIGSFSNFQNEIPNRMPFNWFYGISAGVQNIPQQSTPSFPTYTMDMPLLGTEFEILSQATIDKFIDANSRELFKDVIMWSVILTIMSMIFFTVGSAFGRLDTGVEVGIQGENRRSGRYSSMN